MGLLKTGVGLITKLLRPLGFLWVDSLLANKVQMRFPHVARASLHFPTWLLQLLLRAEHTLEHFLSEEGRKQPFGCGKLVCVVIQMGPGGLEDGREEKKARASALKHVSQPSSVIFPCSSRGKGRDVSVAAVLGLCLRGGPSVVPLLGFSSLVREMFLGGSDESSRLVLFEGVMWARRLQQPLGR